MPSVRDIAIVLRRIEYSESSQVLALLTREHGRVRIIAKGVKRSTKTRFAPAIDLLEEGGIVFAPRAQGPDALSILVEWKQTRAFSGLRERLPRLRAAEYLAETTGLLTQDFDPHPALFDTLAGALERLAVSEDGGCLPVVAAFQASLLRETGLMPRFDACVMCEGNGPFPYFSAFEGGVLCRNCETRHAEKRALTASTLQALREGHAEREPVGAFDVLDYHLSHAAGRQPRTSAHVVSAAQRKRLT